MATDFERNRSVSTDMERLFGPSAEPGAASDARSRRDSLVTTVVDGANGSRGSRHPRRWLLLAAPLLVALFVLVLAVRFALTLVPENSVAAARPVPPAPRASPAAYSAQASPPRPVTETVTEDTLAPDDFGPAPIETPPPAPPRPAAVRTERSVETDREPPAPRTRRDGCAPGSRDDACIYGDVLAADRRLRRAYDAATRAGVETDSLVAIRRRWNRARGISLDAPDETIRRYDELTEQLDDLLRSEQQ
ncbi:hypothetical protein GCM10011380_26650 [Sphingomonas metalli]|uniref:Uncharacterized protein n=1 Tax=Sphingomonas metalli TaxID=1779358 RepID=A0A916T8R6_9SPHN|nr:hypothetical protein [Sphingomonas metalli]GGB35935.1 hypothetical protein GCM10011380_26650 [Sphingomonas metalli]